MKTMFFAAVLVLGVAVIGGAQTAPDMPQVHASVAAQEVNGPLHLLGDVDFTLGTTHIQADEANLGDGHDIELRGNVHLIIAPGRMRVVADTRR